MTRAKNIKRIERHLKAELEAAKKKPCLICGCKATGAHIAMLDPEQSALHFASPGKLRVYIYAVCNEHDVNKLMLPESKEILQAKIEETIICKLMVAN